MILISTGGFSHQCASKTVELLIANNILNVELSGGQYSSTLWDDLHKIKKNNPDVNMYCHNYFPPPQDPFVLNLASLNPAIEKRSLDHCMQAIELAKSLGHNIYSFHAGFLLDPKVSELGRKINNTGLFNRKEALKKFISNVTTIANYAGNDFKILIENNVLSQKNLQSFSGNPLLFTDELDGLTILENCPENVSLLIDVAHLKVSCHSLKKDPKPIISILNDGISAFHLSDNDGTADSNGPVMEDSWFWNELKADVEYFSLEVYDQRIGLLLDQIKLTQEKISNLRG